MNFVFSILALLAAQTQIAIRVIPAHVDGLVQPADLVYIGAFRLPAGQIGTSSFSYGGSALAFNPAHNSLFMVGHPYQQQVAEVAIPNLDTGVSATIATGTLSGVLSSLPTATVLQYFADLSEGRMPLIGQNPASDTQIVGGLLVYQGKLYESVYLYYDGTASQVLSHFVSGLDLAATGDLAGPFQIGSYGLVPGQSAAGFVAGWMVPVPVAWRTALGGPVLVGQCCLPIISRTSLGPAVFAVDPNGLGAQPAPAIPLLYYTGQHVLPDQGGISLANVTTQMGGAVFPEGTRSLLFFGRVGLGKSCYGEGTDDLELDGQSVNGGVDIYCYDPAEGSKGPHMFPYTYFVWAYDAQDLAKVKQGQLMPWDVRPYATWKLPLPSSPPEQILQGVTLDPATNLIFVSQYHGDGDMPLVHVLAIRK